MKIGRGCAAVTGTKSESHCFGLKMVGMGRTESRQMPEVRKHCFPYPSYLRPRRFNSFADEEGEDNYFGLRLFPIGKDEGFFL